MVFASSVVDVFAFSRLISPDCAITSTACEVAARASVKFTVAVWPTATLVGCDTRGAESRDPDSNPVGSRIDLREEETSLALLFTTRTAPVFTSVAFTSAPAIAAPLGSARVPESALLVPLCAISERPCSAASSANSATARVAVGRKPFI